VTSYSHDGYVDDARQITDLMVRGARYNSERRRFTWREDWEKEDMEEDLPDEVRMGKICQVALNAVSEDLKFTVETVYDFENNRLATLDFECEFIENQISYSYFQKSMKTPLFIGAESAMQSGITLTSMSL
jgi:hypothetical protein